MDWAGGPKERWVNPLRSPRYDWLGRGDRATKNGVVEETGVLRQIGVISVKVMKNPGFWAIGLCVARSRMIGSTRAIANQTLSYHSVQTCWKIASIACFKSGR